MFNSSVLERLELLFKAKHYGTFLLLEAIMLLRIQTDFLKKRNISKANTYSTFCFQVGCKTIMEIGTCHL